MEKSHTLPPDFENTLCCLKILLIYEFWNYYQTQIKDGGSKPLIKLKGQKSTGIGQTGNKKIHKSKSQIIGERINLVTIHINFSFLFQFSSLFRFVITG